jgi:hypothetical protein
LIGICYQATQDRQNQRNLVDLELGVENKSRTVRHLLFHFIGN